MAGSFFGSILFDALSVTPSNRTHEDASQNGPVSRQPEFFSVRQRVFHQPFEFLVEPFGDFVRLF